MDEEAVTAEGDCQRGGRQSDLSLVFCDVCFPAVIECDLGKRLYREKGPCPYAPPLGCKNITGRHSDALIRGCLLPGSPAPARR